MLGAFFQLLATTRLADDADVEAAQRRLESIARLLDSAFVIPGTRLRIGADALLNVVPGVGFLVSKGLAAYLIWEARRLGAPGRMLARMLGNLGIDALISAVPVLGWIADAAYRANDRNMEMLRAHLARECAARGRPVVDISAA